MSKKATIIAVVNQKGGTGKTTTTENLGVGLALEGKKVLLVDTDPQASLTVSLGNPCPDDLSPTLSDLMGKIMASTYGLPEMARMLGVHRQTIYYIVANEDFELIKVGRYKRATKESFEKWYHNQTRYQLAEDRQERS